MSTMNYTYTTLDADAELSRLIGTLRINAKDSENTSQDIPMAALQTDDIPPGGITSGLECQSHTNVTGHSHAEPFGCALLRTIYYHIEAYPTTGGAYINTIFAHRASFHTSPTEHEGCARAFSDLARKIDDRQWRPDRESDQEAVIAFFE